MDTPRDVVPPIADAFSDALSGRLIALAVHGSVVTGDAIPGFSDIDLVVFCAGSPGHQELHRLRERLRGVDYREFSYIQWKVVDVHYPPAGGTLVPDAHVVWSGEIDDAWLMTEQSLIQSGREWLDLMPRIIDEDERDWAVEQPGTPSEQRRVRLLLTRLKPAIRARLVEQGEPALEIWKAPWPRLQELWAATDPEAGGKLAAVLGCLERLGDGRPQDATRWERLDFTGWELVWLARRAVTGPAP